MAKTIFPCNDPRREDWAIFSRILEREEKPGAGESDAAAATRLKALLLESFERQPDSLIRMSLHRAKGKGSAVTELMHHPVFAGADRERFYATIRSGLWAMNEDGQQRKVSDRNLKRGRGSSYNAITYWSPQEGGLLPYIKDRISMIVKEEAERQKHRNSHEQSLEVAQQAGLDIVIDPSQSRGNTLPIGHFARRQRDTSDDADAMEKYDDGDGETDSPSRLEESESRAASSAGGGKSEAAETSVRLPEDAPGVAVLNRLLDSLTSESGVNTSPLGNAGFVSQLSTFGVDASKWSEAAAQNAIAPLNSEENSLQESIRHEMEESIGIQLIEALGGFSALPDALQLRIEEAGLDTDDGAAPAVDRDPSETDDDLGGPSDLQQAGTGKPTAAFEHAFGRIKFRLLDGHRDGLTKASRPEFAFFSYVLGQKIAPMDSPEARNVQLKALALEVAREKCEGLLGPDEIAKGISIEDDVADWDPQERLFGETFPDIVGFLEEKELARFATQNKSEPGNHQTKESGPSREAALKNLSERVAGGGELLGLADIPSPMAAPDAMPASLTTRAGGDIEMLASDPIVGESMARGNDLAAQFWDATARGPEDLDDPERVDHLYLTAALNAHYEAHQPDHPPRKVDMTLEPDELHARIKEMAIEWLPVHLEERSRDLTSRYDKLEQRMAYDPTKSIELFANKLRASRVMNQFKSLATDATLRYDASKDGFFGEILLEAGEVFKKQQIQQQMDANSKEAQFVYPDDGHTLLLGVDEAPVVTVPSAPSKSTAFPTLGDK